MAVQWETLNVFVSSTFRDLELERDRLAHIFQEIEKDILERQLTVRPYDLRWRDHHSRQYIVDWCLQMVNSCQYFIGILGNRYGWRPPLGPGGIENTANISITEMEIDHAIASIPKEQRFFCFSEFSQGVEPGQDLQSLVLLKKKLEDCGESVFRCHSLEELVATIDREFRRIVDHKYPPGEKVVPVAYTYEQMIAELVAEKTRGFVGRESYLRQLRDFFNADNRTNYLAIQALAGTGKSSLLAKYIGDLRDTATPLVVHFLSMGGNSREVAGIIYSIAEQLRNQGVITQELKSDPAELHHQVRSALAQAQQRIWLVIDGIDEISEEGRDLKWLPTNLPEQVRVVITSRPVDTWDALQRDFPHIQTIELETLRDDEIAQIIADYDQQHQLQLSREDRELLRKRAAGNPLFLKVALDEILASGTAVGQLALTIEELFRQILQRLHEKHGKQLIEDYLGLIAAGRAGVSEKELGEMLRVGDDVLFVVSQALRNFIITRRGLLDFFHREFERTVKMSMGKSGMRHYHKLFAEYLESKGYQYIRTVDELPYQLQWAEEYRKLLYTLTDYDFLQAKCDADMVSQLSRDFEFAIHGVAVGVPKNFRTEVTPGVGVNREILTLLKRIIDLDIQFLQYYPEMLFQTLWNYGYWHDCNEAKIYYQEVGSVEDAPWQRPGDKLCRLVEHWRVQREQCKQQAWLKTLRPPAIRLDSPLLKVFRGHEEMVLNVAFHPDGSKIASVSDDCTARIWDFHSGEMLHVLEDGTETVSCVAFNPDGSKIITGCHDGNIRIWDSQSGSLLSTLTGHERPVYSVAFSHSGQKIASGSLDRTVRIWSSEGVEHILQGHRNYLYNVTFSPDDRQLLSASEDNTMRIWDVDSGESIQILEIHEKRVIRAAFSPDGQRIVSGSHDGTAKVYDLSRHQVLFSFEYKTKVDSVGYSPDGSYIVVGTEDNALRIYDSGNGALHKTLHGYDKEMKRARFSLDGKYIVTAAEDHSVRIWDVDSDAVRYKLKGHEEAVLAAKFAPGGSRLLSVGQDSICIWNAYNGELLQVLQGHESEMRSVEFSPDGSKVVAGSDDSMIRIWDTHSGRYLHTLAGHQKHVRSVAFSPDGSKIVSGSYDRTVRLWDAHSGQLIKALEGHEGAVEKVCFSPDGKKVASGALDNTVRLWDVHAGVLLQTLQGHKNLISCLQFSEDSTKLLSGSVDGAVRLWHVETGDVIRAFEGHQNKVEDVCFTPDGMIISRANDGTMRFWQIDSGENLETIEGNGDIRSLALPSGQVPKQIISRNGETVVENKMDKTVEAFFPGVIDYVTVFANNIAIGASKNYIYIMELCLADERKATEEEPQQTQRERVPQKGKFTVVNGRQAGMTFFVEAEEKKIIGRDNSCHIQVLDKGLSRNHTLIEQKKEQFLLIDLGSSNGTFVNNKIIRSHALQNGDVIKIGQTEIVFEEEQKPVEEKPALPSALAQIVVKNGKQQGHSFPLCEGDKKIIGRDNSCHIQVLDKGISRNHTLIEHKGDHFLVVDLGSTNGTFANDKIIISKRLAEGDIIKIGQTKLEYQELAREAPSPALIAEDDTSLQSTILERYENIAECFEKELQQDLQRESVRDTVANTYLQTIYAISEVLNAHNEAEKLYAGVADKVMEALRPDCFIVAQKKSDETFEIVFSREERNSFPVSQTILKKVVADRASCIASGMAMNDALDYGRSIMSMQVKSVMCVPMEVGEKVIGALYLTTQATTMPFRRTHLRLLAAIAKLLALAIVRSTHN